MLGQEVMEHPVILSDGFSYERSAIQAWFGQSGSDRSPMTNEPLKKGDQGLIMIPNHTLKALIAHSVGHLPPQK